MWRDGKCSVLPQHFKAFADHGVPDRCGDVLLLLVCFCVLAVGACVLVHILSPPVRLMDGTVGSLGLTSEVSTSHLWRYFSCQSSLCGITNAIGKQAISVSTNINSRWKIFDPFH